MVYYEPLNGIFVNIYLSLSLSLSHTHTLTHMLTNNLLSPLININKIIVMLASYHLKKKEKYIHISNTQLYFFTF